MSSTLTKPIEEDSALTSDQILRSINIVFDADYPERIAHFFPTTKTIDLLKRLLSENQSSGRFVVAPYGSGKSLLAAFYQQVVENRADAMGVLRPVIERIGQIDDALHQVIGDRASSDQIPEMRARGLVIPLSGYVASIPAALHHGLIRALRRVGDDSIADEVEQRQPESMDDTIDLFTHMREQYGGSRFDHLDVMWDEFGRHLEEIVVRGEAHRLNELQLLSEFAVRSRRFTMQLVLFLHQSLMRYASNVPQSVIHEWKKIEGRFETHQYIDDSKEIIALAARVIGSRYPDSRPDGRYIERQIAKLRDVGLFTDFADDELEDIMVAAWPLLPAALYVLPRISARVAQNERTLFSFIFDLANDAPVSPAGVFDYFSDLMRSDASFGGTYHHWLETQSALSNAEDDTEERIIKTLSLLALGLSGERNRVSRALLRVASETTGDAKRVQKSIDGLIGRKLLLHRKNADTVLLWHATDVDLRGRLENERTRLFNNFDLLRYLNDFLPPEDWRPVEYNSEKRMFRFFTGLYVSASEVLHADWLQDGWESISVNGDGVVWYVIPESDEDIEQVTALLEDRVTDPRIVSLVPRGAEGMFETALEAASIQSLLKDTSLAAEDPLVVPELQQMLDDTQAYLMRVLDKMYSPSPEGPWVFSEGVVTIIRSRRAFRQFLSAQIRKVFPDTPVLDNELINKMSPSRVVANARKKLTLGILDRYGTADLGLEGNRPDRSMFATLLLRTGLYFEDEDGRWRFAHPDEVRDPDLRRMWSIVEAFFSHKDATPRSFSELFEELQSPPIGIRSGVMPILLAAGFRAFPSAVTVSDPSGNYVPDILPTTIEEIAGDPHHYTIATVPLDKSTRGYLCEMEQVFLDGEASSTVETDPLRRCYDALEAWKARLPRASLMSRKFAKPVQVFQKLIATFRDPSTLFLDRLFVSYGLERKQWRKLVDHVREWKEDLESVVDNYYQAAGRSILAALQLTGASSVREAGQEWVALLPDGIESRLRDGVSKAVVQRFRMPYDTDEAVIDSCSSLLIGKRIHAWDDSAVALFEREFRNAIRAIEDEALDTDHSDRTDSEVAKGLIAARIRSLYTRLRDLTDNEEAQDVLKRLLEED